MPEADTAAQPSGNSKPLLYNIPSALLVPAIGVTGYAAAHLLESSYLGHFGVPPSFAHISFNTAVLATATLTGVTLGSLYLTLMLTAALRDETWRYGGALERGVALLVFVWFIYSAVTKLSPVALLAGAGVVIVGTHILGPTISFIRTRIRAKRGRTAKRERRPTARARPTLYPISVALTPLLGRDGLVLAGFLILWAYGAGFLGAILAKRTTQYLVPVDSPEYIVLRVYDEVAVLASLDRSAHTVGPEFRVVSVKELRVKLEDLGPLEKSPVPPLAERPNAMQAAPPKSP